jgi:riboflavin kinase/FMN adenylyltransferase
MKVINGIEEINESYENLCVAIGTFDGIHYGHRQVIESAIKKAKELGGKSLVFTFEHHPLEVVNKEKAPKLINSKNEKIHILEQIGVDAVLFAKFNREFAGLSPNDFIEFILKEKLNAKEVFVGFNFSFGKGGAANVDKLVEIGKMYGIKVNKVEPFEIDNRIVSSTLIRELIDIGKLDDVEKYLGYPVLIMGEVVHGKKLGKVLGYPTANLKILNKVYPPYGIYGAKVVIEGENFERDAVVNIGQNPTLKPGEKSVEVHILDFDKYIYGKELLVKIVKFLRTEKKFDSIDELKKGIRNDILEWKEHLKREKQDGNKG